MRDPGHEFLLLWRDSAGSSGRPASYRVGTTTPPNQARVVGVARHVQHWTCSFANAIRLEFEGTAIAYRVAWGDGSTTILPADGGVLWSAGTGEAPPPPRVTAAELGHINCMGHSVAPEALARPRPFELYALYADGSEVRIGSSIAQLGEDGVRLPIELVGDAHEDDGEIAPQRVTPAVEAWAAATVSEDAEDAGDAGDADPAFGATVWSALRPWAIGIGMIGGVVALVVAALLRPRRRDHEPRL